MSFEQCVTEAKKAKNLKTLFATWRKAHVEEVKIIKNAIDIEQKEKRNEKLGRAEIFETCIYKKRGKNKECKKYLNTISSHYVQFFHKIKSNCEECLKNGGLEKNEVWEYV